MRPRPALPFTLLAEPGVVRLVAGEDLRFALRSPGIDVWLPPLWHALDGRRSLEEALALVPDPERGDARALVEQLVGERVLVGAEVELGVSPEPHRLVVEGEGALRRAVDRALVMPQGSGVELRVLCQDELDDHRALIWAERSRDEGARHLWASVGPGSRALISPVFLPEEGPCFACLIGAFRLLSPAPEVRDALLAHARAGGTVLPMPFPPHGLGVAAGLLLWKASLLAVQPLAPACFVLHSLEARTLEVASHPLASLEGCAGCAAR